MDNTLEKIIINFFNEHVKFAFLFGSANNKYFSEKSDIDIAVWLKKHPIPIEKFLELKYQAEKAIKFEHEIDLVILNNSDIIIVNQIMSKGKLIINNDPAFTSNFINSRQSLYFDFKFWRKNLEENMKMKIL